MSFLVPLLGEVSTAQEIFLVGLALLIVVLLVRSRRYFRQVTQYQIPRPDASSTPRGPHPATMPPREFEKWEVAMHDLARDLSGQLDSKIRILELLIREADKVAGRLESTLAPRGRMSNRREKRFAQPRRPRTAKNPASGHRNHPWPSRMPLSPNCQVRPTNRDSTAFTPWPTRACRPQQLPIKSAARSAKWN